MMTFSSRSQRTPGNLGWRERVSQMTQRPWEPRCEFLLLLLSMIVNIHSKRSTRDMTYTLEFELDGCHMLDSFVLIRHWYLFDALTSFDSWFVYLESEFILSKGCFVVLNAMCWQSVFWHFRSCSGKFVAFWTSSHPRCSISWWSR